MTKRREDGSFEGAILEIVRTLGAGAAAEVVHLSPKTLRDYSDPARAGRPRLAEAVRLDAACMEKTGKAPLLDVYLQRLVEVIPELADPVAPTDDGSAAPDQGGSAPGRDKPRSMN
nr:hypothetical protein [uncultured Dongia sp.]